MAVLDRMNDALNLGIAFPVEPEADFETRQDKLFKSRGDEEGSEDDETEDERDPIWSVANDMYSGYDRYAARANRKIPILILTPSE